MGWAPSSRTRIGGSRGVSKSIVMSAFDLFIYIAAEHESYAPRGPEKRRHVPRLLVYRVGLFGGIQRQFTPKVGFYDLVPHI